MKPLRIGYIGAGFMAQKVHLPNFAKIEGCELVALAEKRPRLRERVADLHRVPRRFPDHLAMLDAGGLDAVALSAAYGAQAGLAVDCLRRGLPVFMEKPMATSLRDAERVLDACREGGGRLMVGYMRRYDRGNILGRDLIRAFQQSGELGRVTYVRCHGFLCDFSDPQQGWVGGLDSPCVSTDEPVEAAPCDHPDWMSPKVRQPYVSFLQQYTHNFNLVRWLLGAKDGVRIRHVDLNDHAGSGVVGFEVGGVRAILEAGHVSHHGWEDYTQVYFDHGWVKLSSPPLLLRNVPVEVEVYRSRPRHETSYPVPSPAWTWSYLEELRHFVHAVRTGAPFESDAEDTVHDVRAFEDIFRVFQAQREGGAT